MTRVIRGAGLSLSLAIAWLAIGCRPTQCGARDEACCNGTCLGAMTCVSDVCRAPCAGPLEACDAVTGAGCPAGSTCRLTVSGDTIVAACVEGEPGPGLFDTPCSEERDCAAGLLCYRDRCRFVCCDRDTDCADPLQFCVPFEGFGICEGDAGCDVFSGAGCGDEYACYPFVLEAGGYTPTCLPPGALPPLSVCSEPFDCLPGHRCVRDRGEDRTCLPICDAAHPCTSGAGCLELAGNPGFGVCAAP